MGLHAREKVAVLAIEVVALLSRTSSLWRAVHLDGVRQLVGHGQRQRGAPRACRRQLRLNYDIIFY
jgi:hypothetical protein